MPNLGETTQDLRTTGRPNPAEKDLHPDVREDTVQARGHRHRRAGLLTILGALGSSLASALLAEGRVFDTPAAQTFAFLALVGTIALGCIYVAAGLFENHNRHSRAVQRQILAEVQQVQTNAAEDRERLDLVIGLVSAFPGRLDTLASRLDALERAIDKVPAYSDGVIHGVTLRNDAMGNEGR